MRLCYHAWLQHKPIRKLQLPWKFYLDDFVKQFWKVHQIIAISYIPNLSKQVSYKIEITFSFFRSFSLSKSWSKFEELLALQKRTSRRKRFTEFCRFSIEQRGILFSPVKLYWLTPYFIPVTDLFCRPSVSLCYRVCARSISGSMK